MLLAIDVGNTQTCFGVYDGATLVQHFRMASDRSRTSDEYGVTLGQMLRDVGLDFARLTAAIVASVVPPLTPVFARMCQQRLTREPLVVGPGIKTGMPVLYESPRDVGADRIVNGIAGFERYRHAAGGPFGVIIVDFGTATTFDVVSPKGEYLGGAIAPGIQSSAEALFKNASKLPRVDLVMPESSIGKTTVSSMQAGILFGYVALVDGLVGQMVAELSYRPKVIATGGLARVIADRAKSIEAVDDYLTMEGLRIIYERNGGGR